MDINYIAIFVIICIIVKIFMKKERKIVKNPFLQENFEIMENFDRDIQNNLSDEYKENHYMKWFPIYMKYYCSVSSEYMKFKVYDVLYDVETYIFENKLIELMNDYKRILDFGCGTCKIWRNNRVFNRSHNIHCIDLDEAMLAYPKHLLRNDNIEVSNANLFNLEIEYDVVLFSEVIMQLDKPEEFLKYIVDKNPNTRIIMCHTVFTPFMSSVLSPFKNCIMKCIPIFNVACGKALTYQQTSDIIKKGGCIIEDTVSIRDNKIIFVCKKAD